MLASSSAITTVRPSGVMIAPRQVTSFSWSPGGGSATGLLLASRSEPGRVTSSSRTVLCDGHPARLGPTNATCLPSPVQDSASTFVPASPSPPLLGLHWAQVLKLHARSFPVARLNTTR